MALPLEQIVGRVRLDSSVPLTYLKTSASSGWSGAGLTHMKTSSRGEFVGCWSALTLTYNLGPADAYFFVDAQGRHQRGIHRLNLAPPDEEKRGGWDRDAETINLFIQPSFIESVLGRPFDETCILDRLATHRDDSFIALLMQALLTDVLADSPNGNLAGEGVIAAIVQRLEGESACKVLAGRDNSASRRQLGQALDYVEAHLGESLHLDEIAASIGIGVRQLSRLFRAQTGQAPYQYILRRRLEKAGGLIAAGRLSLDDVAAATGFADRNHMTTTFTKMLGKTPTQFRN